MSILAYSFNINNVSISSVGIIDGLLVQVQVMIKLNLMESDHFRHSLFLKSGHDNNGILV